MYDELIKRLRERSVFLFPHHGESRSYDADLMHEAADAIEELQKQLQKSEEDNVNLTGWLAEEHAKQCPHYIRNIHDRGDDSLCDKWVCEVKSLPKWIPVTERLPVRGKKVLVFAYGHDVLTARLRKETENDYPVFECNGIYLEMAKQGRITHWIQLPEPPEEGI